MEQTSAQNSQLEQHADQMEVQRDALRRRLEDLDRSVNQAYAENMQLVGKVQALQDSLEVIH